MKLQFGSHLSGVHSGAELHRLRGVFLVAIGADSPALSSAWTPGKLLLTDVMRSNCSVIALPRAGYQGKRRPDSPDRAKTPTKQHRSTAENRRLISPRSTAQLYRGCR